MDNIVINGYLEELKNYNVFYKYVCGTTSIFIETFGKDIMEKIDLYIDNATVGSGYTPVTVPLFKKIIIIKLGIPDFSDKERIVYQYAHELCHYVFYSLKGFDKEKDNYEEESICSAMSLVLINKLFPDSIVSWMSYVSNLEDNKYRDGAKIVETINFDIVKLKEMIYRICN